MDKSKCGKYKNIKITFKDMRMYVSVYTSIDTIVQSVFIVEEKERLPTHKFMIVF